MISRRFGLCIQRLGVCVGGYFLVVCRWMSWGLIFAAGLTIMGLHFHWNNWNGTSHFRDLGDQKNQVVTDLKIEGFLLD